MNKTTLGVIVTNRNFFADSLVANGRKAILGRLAELGVNVVTVDESMTDLGAVETWSDAQKCAALRGLKRRPVDVATKTGPWARVRVCPPRTMWPVSGRVVSLGEWLGFNVKPMLQLSRKLGGVLCTPADCCP